MFFEQRIIGFCRMYYLTYRKKEYAEYGVFTLVVNIHNL